MAKKNLFKPTDFEDITTREAGNVKYYYGVPDKLGPSTMKNNKEPYSNIVKEGMVDPVRRRSYEIKNQGPLPNNSQF